ncbi:MAG: Rieske (2Fe-2S) protein [Acidobacteriota bacterium]|nr:Rieske (2Fe-2S) protein [Acidobacteriota bacterium]
MKPSDPGASRPLWREEFAIDGAEERYVSRRQFGKFLTLASLAMFAGNLWILLRSWLLREPVYPIRQIARVDDIPVGGVRLFGYPSAQDACILLRPEADTFLAFSQKCTHLSCAVYYAAEKDRLECPCHEGFFEARTGRVLQGPPKRPLPRIVLERRGNVLMARGIDLQREA